MGSRRSFLKKSLLGISGLSIMQNYTKGNNSNQNQNKPNLLFIVTDDLNDWVGELGGHPQAHTPNIDELMKRGVSFTNAYSNNPICAPSRASFLTGLYPHTSGYFGYKQNQAGNQFRNFDKLKNAQTMMEHFYDNGYNVYGTGKVFHSRSSKRGVWKGHDDREHFGILDTFGPVAWDGSHKRGNMDYEMGLAHPQMLRDKNESLSYSKSFASLANIPEYPSDPDKNIPGYKGWVCFGEPFKYENEQNRDKMPDELNVEYAREILNAEHERPFFLTVGFNRPHTPLHAPDKYFKKFSLDEIKMPKIKEDDLSDVAGPLGKPTKLWNNSGRKHYKFLTEHPEPDMLKKWVRAYLANVAFIDDQIGKLLDTLRDSEHNNNTIVILTSDHGYHLGEKEWVFKSTPWEESARIPLVIDTPDLENRGAEVSHPVSLIDLYPTMIDLCDLPENPNAKAENPAYEGYRNQIPLDGYSLAPFLSNPNRNDWEGPDVALTSVASDTKLEPGEPGDPEDQFYTVRSERYRYILCPNGEEELYDHKNDPYEWNNLANDTNYSGIKRKLNRKLKSLVFQD